MSKVCIVGHFGGNNKFYDGQTVKTKNLYRAIKDRFNGTVNKTDTYGWKKNPIFFFIKCLISIKKNDSIIVLPAHNGVKIIIPLFVFFNKIYHKKLFYVVIGGWLPSLLKDNKKLLKKMKKLNSIFVETEYMKNELNKMGLNNIEILLNFKDIKPVISSVMTKKESSSIILRSCIFSRVIYEKGIEDAINVISNINKTSAKKKCTLDIYGPIGDDYINRFNNIMKNSPEFINYKGIVDSSKSVETIQKYDILSFPTKFKTEGLPGTIIDSYCAGVPVMTSNWNSAKEFVIEEKTGFIYKFNDTDDLYYKIIKLMDDLAQLNTMRRNCIEFSKKFNEENAIIPLLNKIK